MEERRPVPSAKRGAYYKGRTKAWLEGRGYQVAHLEMVHYVFRGVGRPMPVKRDQFGSDLLAVSASEIIFVQVKSASGSVLDARRKFVEYVFPPMAKRWVVSWQYRARSPEITDCSEDTTATVPVVRSRVRTRLF